ncbi:MAG TPA: MFS transporter [Acetobacteraceae bacterium]|jgi:ACDE family multidrug resistance protein|nr:MFS transporter [Acetobacteraceae bacterium]
MSTSTDARGAAVPYGAATIGGLPRRKAMAFLSLFFVPAVAQAILLTVVPLEALQLVGDARAVTLLYVSAGLVAVAGRFSIPFLVRLLTRRFVFSLGALSMALSAALMAAGWLPAFAVGLPLSILAFGCVEITSQLYLMDNVARHELRRFEPVRIFASAGPWTLGPWLGVYLQRSVGFAAPFAITMAASVTVVALFWWLRLGENAVITSTRRPPPSPARYLLRFFAQPRLRLAWTLAVARSSWWNMFFVYTPIFAVTSGLGAETGGVIVSIGSAWMWLVPLWGWAGRRYGLRRLLMAGYAVTGVLSICAALAFHIPWLGAVMILLAAFGTETIDGAGNLLFLRAVHPHERPEMTTVFASYRDMAQLGPPVVFSLLLSVFSLPSVFVAGGVIMLASAAVARHIPRRL